MYGLSTTLQPANISNLANKGLDLIFIVEDGCGRYCFEFLVEVSISVWCGASDSRARKQEDGYVMAIMIWVEGDEKKGLDLIFMVEGWEKISGSLFI